MQVAIVTLRNDQHLASRKLTMLRCTEVSLPSVASGHQLPRRSRAAATGVPPIAAARAAGWGGAKGQKRTSGKEIECLPRASFKTYAAVYRLSASRFVIRSSQIVLLVTASG